MSDDAGTCAQCAYLSFSPLSSFIRVEGKQSTVQDPAIKNIHLQSSTHRWTVRSTHSAVCDFFIESCTEIYGLPLYHNLRMPKIDIPGVLAVLSTHTHTAAAKNWWNRWKDRSHWLSRRKRIGTEEEKIRPKCCLWSRHQVIHHIWGMKTITHVYKINPTIIHLVLNIRVILTAVRLLQILHYTCAIQQTVVAYLSALGSLLIHAWLPVANIKKKKMSRITYSFNQ